MILTLIGFELRRRLKQLSTWVYAVVLFAAGFFIMLAAGGVFSELSVSSGNERVMVNSPHSLFGTTAALALYGLFTVAAVFGQAAYQDFGHDTWMIIFTKNVRKAPYLIGRFLGAFVFSAVLFLTIGLGQLGASFIVHFVKPEHLGPSSALAYLWPYLLQVWPMLFFSGALFFTLAALTRKMAPVYVGVVVLVLGYALATTLLQDVQDQTLAAMLDPFGFLSFEVVTRYWTPAERNRDLVSVVNVLGANRLLWTAVAVGLLALTVRRFRTTVDEQRGKALVDEERSTDKAPYPTLTGTPTTMGWLRASASFAWMYFREVTRSPVYWAFIVSGLAFVTILMAVSKEIFGTATLPVTYQAIELAQGSFGLFTLITIIFYSGELVFRDRDAGTQDIIDATRSPTWVGFLARLGALLLVALSLEVVVGASALVSQVSRGFFAIEWRLYASELSLELGHTALLCVLALFVQVLVNHKYLGHFAMVGYYVLQPLLRYLGVEDRLVRYASEPGVQYSDMNGYGHFLWALLWYRLYWTGFALLLLTFAYLFFLRGREAGFRARRSQVGARFTGPWRAVAALGLVAWVGAGAFCFYNTRVLNEFRTRKDDERERAEYEKKYKQFATLPQPRITGAKVDFDVFPSQHRLVVAGTYRLKNNGQAPVTRVFVNLVDDAIVRKLVVADASSPAKDSDVKRGTFLFDLPRPMEPGEEADLVYDLEFAEQGFRHRGGREDVVENGTFFNNFNLPILGYMEDAELSEDGDRKSYGFAPKERMAPRDDVVHLQRNYIRQDSDFVTYEATVSTEAGELAVTPGTLEREWVEGGRPHWRYTMDQPILNFFSVLSARYAVKRDEAAGVKLEIYYHPAHTWNLERMMAGMKDGLAYCSDAFGPYQFKQARILEFPRYQVFAQSYPGTVPYSEAVGFIARVREDEPDDVDYPYYVTAHEIAHQWWAHQVVGADVRGATMTSESMAQYSALMVLKKKYGPERMRRFLKFELDHYLTGRATESKKELPLADNENQMYIHYQKGSLAMYALQDFIGEERVNRALKKYVAAVRFKGPPYTTSTELLSYLREETPANFQYLLEDLFETITLYDNRTEEASMKKSAAGGWDVKLKVKAQKFRSDDKGDQTELEFDDWMDVGALDEKGTALFLEKRKVKKGQQELTFTVATRPAKVGVDPLNVLIDRNSDDNVKAPSEE